MEKFEKRWEDSNPKSVAVHDPEAAQAAARTVKERKGELTELSFKADAIRKDCEHFAMDSPSFPLLLKVRLPNESEDVISSGPTR